jgi:hypothetical protein
MTSFHEVLFPLALKSAGGLQRRTDSDLRNSVSEQFQPICGRRPVQPTAETASYKKPDSD